jgi:excisionase family DNA binding protein
MERTQENPLALTVKEALRLIGLGRTKFYQLIAQGKISTVHVGRRRLIIYDSLKAFLEQGDAK